MSHPDSPQPTKSLNYNVKWMSKTFNSRAQVESILGPEHTAGYISPHDYNAAMSFLPGYHRYYGLVSFSSSILLFLFLRKPTWSRRRLFWTTTFGSLTALNFGRALTLRSHFNFVYSLDNPDGFAAAIDRIQIKRGTTLPESLVIHRKYSVEEGLHGNIENRPDFVPPEPAVERSSTSPSPQVQAPASETRASSRWDQIRTANAATTNSSSWDAIRQKHEKPRISGSTTPDQNLNRPTDDRAAEQARFDALLEKERNMGNQS